jgi:hypothetical protein
MDVNLSFQEKGKFHGLGLREPSKTSGLAHKILTIVHRVIMSALFIRYNETGEPFTCDENCK